MFLDFVFLIKSDKKGHNKKVVLSRHLSESTTKGSQITQLQQSKLQTRSPGNTSRF